MGLSSTARAEQAHPRQKQRFPSVASSQEERVTELRMRVGPSGGGQRLKGCGEWMAKDRAGQAPAAQATEPAYLLEANCFAASAGTNFLR
jgi:hypothetical protein